jgi:hypothetical protein
LVKVYDFYFDASGKVDFLLPCVWCVFSGELGVNRKRTHRSQKLWSGGIKLKPKNL